MKIKSPHQLLLTLALLISGLLFSFSASALTNMEGKQVSLSNYLGKGKWTIVEAWHSRCNICNSSMPITVKSVPTFKNAQHIGISLDGNKNTAQQFVNRHKINFPTLLSNTTEFNLYLQQIANEKLIGTPVFLMFNPQGQLTGVQQGFVKPNAIRRFINQH
jgi:peroxiredoxin